jgi:S-DNA-T family DNA segregation ATPase FtsK/SpoIIIE
LLKGEGPHPALEVSSPEAGFLRRMQEESRREIFAFLFIGFTAFLWVCLLTHDAGDFLGSPHPLKNACGPVGAFVSFHSMLWLGKTGAFGLAIFLGVAGLLLLFRKAIEQWGWKVLGATLILIAVSSFEVALKSQSASFDTLPGGYYGQFFYGFLLSQLSTTGTYLLLSLVLLVAFMISTDTIFYPALARVGGTFFDAGRWQAAARTVRKQLPAIPKVSLPHPKVYWGSKEDGAPEPKGKKKQEGKKGTIEKSSETARDGEPSTPETGSTKGAPRAADHPPRSPDLPETEDMTEDAAKAAGASEETTEEAGRLEPRLPLKIRVLEPSEQAPRKKPAAARVKQGPYRLPPLELLDVPQPAVNPLDRTLLEQTAAKIEETLKHFKIEARVVEVQKGPTITQYELSLAAGIKVHKIMNLSDDLAMALKAPSIRIVAPIPGKSTVGIEVPNKTRSTVGLRELLESAEFRDEDYKLPLALGKDVAGNPVVGDLGDMPHLLIAGSTGSGKSVSINSIITNLLLTRTPEEVKLILVDPKMVELAQFENIPHLLAPVVTDMKKAPAVLGWTVDKMEERYELFAMAGVRHILSYNALGREKLRERLEGKLSPEDMDDFPDSLPFIVVIIDELADLMMTSSKEVEASITRLSQKSRAVGIHVILATQRPSVDVITGLIKANMPSRISFHVASKVDSRTILDRNGAEKLLGKGDLLYLPPGTSALQRVQGTFISDKEIREVVKFSVQQAEPQFSPELTRFGAGGTENAREEDELYEEAVRIVLGSQRGSVTLLQRQLQIGYTRASRLMELMHENGLVGPFKGSKAREVYYTLEEWEEANARRRSTEKSEDGTSANEEQEGRSGQSREDPIEEDGGGS